MKRVEFKVFTNLTKEELDLQRSLEGNSRFGSNPGEASEFASLRDEQDAAADSLRSIEESEIAEFRMKSYNKTINQNRMVAESNADNIPLKTQNVNPVITIKAKKRKVADTFNNPNSASISIRNSVCDSTENVQVELKERYVVPVPPSSTLQPSSVSSSSSSTNTNVATKQPESSQQSNPSALPVYYSDDEDDS